MDKDDRHGHEESTSLSNASFGPRAGHAFDCGVLGFSAIIGRLPYGIY